MRQLWAMRAASAVVSITGVIVLASSFGLTGAGLASAVGGALYTLGVIIAHRRMRRWAGRHSGGRVGQRGGWTGVKGNACEQIRPPCRQRR